MLKRIIALALVLTFAFAFAACQPAADTSGLKIAIITSPSGVDDGNFNQNNYEGIQAFIENHSGATVNTTREPTGDSTASVNAVRDIVADYDVIVTPGFQFAGIAAIAQENPDKKFILVDSFPSLDGGASNLELENVYAMQFAEQESGFLAGVAAALESKTGKVAIVNGIAFPSNVNYQFGFMCGVYYANNNYGANAEVVEIASYAGTDVNGANVGGNYVGDFADPATGKVVGQALINAGVDVILVAAGGSGNGVFTAAKESSGVMVIGCDVDQYDDGVTADGNIVLTSALKVMNINVERQLNAIDDGSFKGGNVTLYADTDSTGIVTAEGRHQMSADTVSKLNDAFAKLKSGDIVPAANFNGVTVDSFK